MSDPTESRLVKESLGYGSVSCFECSVYSTKRRGNKLEDAPNDFCTSVANHR